MSTFNFKFSSLLEKLGKLFKDRINKSTAAEKKAADQSEIAHSVYYTNISNYLFYILGFIMCYQAASFFWNSIPYKNPVLAGLTSNELKVIRSPKSNIAARNFSLFGVEAPPPSPVVAKSENKTQGTIARTKLNIKITGISASTVQGFGSVVMLYNNSEDVYGIGDKIAKTNATVTKIFPDRVIINNAGVEEIVMLPGEEENLSSNFKQPIKENSTQAPAKEEMKRVRTELLSNPGSLFNYLSIKPAIQDGKTIGYELNPGTDNRMFINAGLKEGDIAVEINGYDLRNSAQAMQAMGDLQNMTEITLVVDRNGSRETISLDLK